jgi:aspartyl aminopeptidase
LDFYQVAAVDRSASSEFKFNTETEFTPILGLLASNLNAPVDKVQSTDRDEHTASDIRGNHHPALLTLLAEEMSVKPEEIHDFELYVSTSLAIAHEHAE